MNVYDCISHVAVAISPLAMHALQAHFAKEIVSEAIHAIRDMLGH